MATSALPEFRHSGKFSDGTPGVATARVDAPVTRYPYVSDGCRLQARMEGECIAEMRYTYFSVGPGAWMLERVIDAVLGRKLSEVAQMGEAEMRAISDADPALSARWTPEKWEPVWRTIRSAFRALSQDVRQPGSGQQLKMMVYMKRHGRVPSSGADLEALSRIPSEMNWDSE